MVVHGADLSDVYAGFFRMFLDLDASRFVAGDLEWQQLDLQV